MRGHSSQREPRRRAARGYRQRRIRVGLAYREQVEAKTCERCERPYKPGKPEQRFCAVECSGSRSVREKMNGRQHQHPWKDWRRRCEWCRKLIGEDRHARRLFCNQKCKHAYFDGLQATARAEARAGLTCADCGGAISGAKRQDRKYCSMRCQWRAAYWRNPDARHERASVRYRAKTANRPASWQPARLSRDQLGRFMAVAQAAGVSGDDGQTKLAGIAQIS